MTDISARPLSRRQFAALVSFGAGFLSLGPGLLSPGAARAEEDKSNLLYMQLKDGMVVIRMRPDLAPKTVAQIKTLVKRGFYDGIVFHRVIEGFMAQTGDPTGTGMGGSDLPNIPAEFNKTPFVRGTVGMARASDPDSANSQFFICLGPAPFLDGKYTAWGEVISGMQNVDKIKKGDPAENGKVESPDKIISMKLGTDVK
ncbi:peptidylprolyl isomerase [Rhodoblastus acidophilus]|uniref:Peptidyl-prolyl cis-trans isomerase n=1 Tax=Candidatus Rhodoblastus alkanivorans TaxID=2954117 RepID=A0ABS9Z9W2_9HYPH|nr:peptidylprolyl isomerase [Candidatus Rhodoblastus alkanivorans]MCI4677941.1 peptidylprolyl isomerase [Candidatus Rhodoblastus alkanivorans]MCI4683836.1 peptidylprolyl isomerase [Candidatus Rhodoblastus alkanivorans]MDI4641154.1 peptidylprolyl isomerase [Rhodoblastus acidophilus]